MRYAAIVDRLAGLGSDKWAVHFRAKQRRLAGDEIILLTIGEPDLPPSPDLVAATCAAMQAGRTGYSNGQGEAGVLAALAAKYSHRAGRVVATSEVMYLPGTQTALYAVMRALAGPGDEVLVGDPLYATYDAVIAAAGATRIAVPLRCESGFHLRPDDLAAALTQRSRVLLLNSPHNPTGAVLSAAEIAAIGEVCRQHDLWIISDEVYEAMCNEGQFASPFDIAGLAERTVVVSSLSKSHAVPGFRSGWCAGPEEFIRRLLPLAEAMLFGSQPFIADMATLALSKTFPQIAAMRTAYQRRARLLEGMLNGTEGDMRFLMPECGMFAMLDIRGLGRSAESFAFHLLEETGVALMPGNAFGEHAEGFVRISLTVPDDDIGEAGRRIRGFINALAAPTHKLRQTLPASIRRTKR
jgi:arginine:pyruvate transaminase